MIDVMLRTLRDAPGQYALPHAAAWAVGWNAAVAFIREAGGLAEAEELCSAYPSEEELREATSGPSAFEEPAQIQVRKPSAKLKVWGINVHSRAAAQALGDADHIAQVRAIVAAPNQSAAASAFGVTKHYLRNYASDGSKEETGVALSEPGTVFATSLNVNKGEWVILER